MLGSDGDFRRAKGSRAHHQLRGGLNDLLGLSSSRLPINERSCSDYQDELQQFSSEEDVSGRHTFSENSEAQDPEDKLPGSSDDLELIGRGAYGCVYKGVWNGRPAAIKVIEHDDELLSETQSETSSRGNPALCTYGSDSTGVLHSSTNLNWLEAGPISSGVEHPNIVQTFASQSSDPFSETRRATGLQISSVQETRIIMEYCDGGPLNVAVDQGRFHIGGDVSAPVDLEAICMTLAEVASALAFLHSMNILHRDLKAKNVLLMSSENERRGFCAKVSDFGLSIRMPEGAQAQTLSFSGTVTHMAPELMLEDIASAASDVYAFGILMWEIYCGGAPYGRLTKTQIMVGVGSEDLRPRFPSTAPHWYKKLAARCWARDAAERPTSADLEKELRKHATIILQPAMPD